SKAGARLVVAKFAGGLWLAAPGHPAAALDRNGQYVPLGLGEATCATWSAARQQGQDIDLRAWLDGYLTAYNRFVYPGTDVAAGRDMADLLAWLDDTCGAQPDLPFSAAVDRLVIVLHHGQ
ncbi:MAG: hypothetical protein RII27_01665, partial [Alphaproteobacteria bacterium]